MKPTAALALLALALMACGPEDPATTPAEPGSVVAVPEPLPPGDAAYEIAGAVELEERAPEDWDDLHNVFHLSPTIISGSEPHGEEALQRIAAMGVKTILSVDGKVPDQDTAAKYGMRYVHVPIQYSGITPDERLRIAKTFREMEGPFFVHCFHGKHRGPAAAAIGRIAIDGAPRERAVAEMRQLCGTSEKYQGLYETVARGLVPTEFETRAFTWSFPAAHEFEGFRHAMIETARIWDHLLATRKNAFEPDPGHPDLNAQNEARKLAEIFETSMALDDLEGQAENFVTWMEESHAEARRLHEALTGFASGGGDAAREDAYAAMEAIKLRCDACHKIYRNEGPKPAN